MKVLFATTLPYLPQSAGGSKISTHTLCSGLKDRGHDVAVLSKLYPAGYLGFRNRLMRRLNKDAIPFDRFSGYKVFRAYDPLRSLDKVCAQFCPDVVFVQAGKWDKLAQKSRELGYPALIYIRDVGFSFAENPPPPGLGMAYISNSCFTASRLHDRFGIQSEIIFPLVSKIQYLVESERSSVLHINPHPLKGVDITLALAEKNPDIPFTLLQSWGLSKEIEDKYKRWSDSLANVSWCSRVRDMRKHYSRARIVIVPSQLEEAWGRVPTEAQFSGIPALASKIGGLPESVGPGGVLVDPRAVIEVWQHALRRLWDDQGYYGLLCDKALIYSGRDEIDPDVLMEKVESILCEVSGR